MAVLSNTGIRGGASAVVADPEPYNVKRSARFNDDDSAYLNWTPAAAGNRKTWTWSAWVKRSSFGAASQTLMQIFPSGMGYTRLRFVDDRFAFDGQASDTGSGSDVKTTRLFRDPSAWYHFCVAMDTTQATDTNRLKVYVNGVQETSFASPTWPTQNVDYMFNYAHMHNIGRLAAGTEYFDGLISNIHFIDGTAKAATDFGLTDGTTGQWVPKAYSGSYGTNGFYLAMDPANGGTDYSKDTVSGNGTWWNSSFTPAAAFNGSTSTYSQTGTDGDTITFTPFGGIAYSTSVEVMTAAASNTATLNGGSAVNLTADTWVSVHSGSGTLTSLVITHSTTPSLKGIKIDGKLLVDHSAIGYDSSGNKNHWHGNNIFGHEATVANDNFKVRTYTGTGSSLSVSGLGFQPDMVWIKSTSNAYNHAIFDVVRGVEKRIQPNESQGEDDSSTGLTAFNSDGFTVGSNSVNGESGVDYVAWCWKAGGAASANNAGSVNASVSANTDAGFSIVSFNSGSGGQQTVAHGLGKAPNLIICKNRDATNNWTVYHSSISSPEDNYILLNTTNAASGAGDIWGSSAPTSTVFGFNSGSNFTDNDNIIAYCWTEKAGVSKIGSYTGNNNNTGPIVDCGFTPGFVLIKRTDAVSNWNIFDNARSLTNDLKPNTDEAEGTSGMSFTANGFQPVSTYTDINANGGTYVYMAFAGSPEGDLDLLADTPGAPYDNELNGGGNYATMNSLDKDSNCVLKNGNLDVTCATNGWNGANATMEVLSGKTYFEVKYGSSSYINIGLNTPNTGVGDVNTDGVHLQNDNGTWRIKNVSVETGISTVAANSVIGVAVDTGANTIQFYVNNVSVYSGTLNAAHRIPLVYGYGTYSVSVNFGQREFAYTPPAGYKTLNAYSLSTPTITKGNTGFNAVTYTGSSSPQTVSGLNFESDLIWIKSRSHEGWHVVQDSIRGFGKTIFPNDTAAEIGNANDLISNVTATGLSVNTTYNNSTDTATTTTSGTNDYVAWAWDAGSSNVTNDASSTGVGTIDSTYRVNTNTGFSIVSYTGSGSNATVAHGLNAAPGFIIVKMRSSAGYNWCVYHKDLTSAQYALALDTTGAEEDSATSWNSTAPTSNVFSIGIRGSVNNSSSTFIAYCWSEVAGYSKFGSWTSTGDSFVYCGFKPRFLIGKCTSHTGDWVMYDTERDSFNQDADNNTLVANVDKEEDGHYNANQTSVDLLSNGFKIRHSGSSPLGDSGRTYIFAAFAESPFKYANAR